MKRAVPEKEGKMGRPVNRNLITNGRIVYREELERLYADKSTTEVSKILKCSDESVRKYLSRYKIPIRSRKEGVNKYFQNKPIFESSYVEGGYVLVYKPNHPFCNSHKVVAEHRLIAEGVLGRYLKKNEVVHHVDGNSLNNNKNNLLICDVSFHQYLHRKIAQNPRDGRGRYCA